MPHFDDTLLQAIPDPALVAVRGRAVCFNDSARRLFPSLGESAPLPEALEVPEGGVGTVLAGGECWTCCASPVRDGTLFLLHPARMEGMSEAQMNGIVRRLREQMAQLLLSVQLLGQSLPEQGDGARRLAGMNRALCQMLRLTDQLDLLHELAGGAFVFRPAPLDLAGLCRQVTDAAASLLEGAEVSLTFASPLSSVLVSGSSELLQKLLLELICNAARAAGRGGALRLTLARRGDRAVLTLAGGGPGDDGRPLTRLLSGSESPERIPRPGEGAGIGLALVQRIVRLHGGALVMERQDGIRVTVSLPAERSSAPLGVRTPEGDYSGGFSPELIALSDLLPDSAFAAPEL